MSISGIMLPSHSISFLAFDSKFVVVVEDFQLQQFYLPSPFPHMQNSTNKLRRAFAEAEAELLFPHFFSHYTGVTVQPAHSLSAQGLKGKIQNSPETQHIYARLHRPQHGGQSTPASFFLPSHMHTKLYRHLTTHPHSHNARSAFAPWWKERPLGQTLKYYYPAFGTKVADS